MLRRKDLHQVHSLGQQGVYQMHFIDGRGVVGHQRYLLSLQLEEGLRNQPVRPGFHQKAAVAVDQWIRKVSA